MITQNLFLLSIFGYWVRFDILVWVFAVPFLAAALWLLVYQRRQYREVKSDLQNLSKVKRNTIEYDLVLKSMRLAIWRIDVPSNTITFQTDYRDSSDSIVLPPNTKMEDMLALMTPRHAERLRRIMDDLYAGRIEECHVQYQMKIPHSDRTYWSELFATVEKSDISGKPLSIVGTSARIDKQKETEQALIEARNHAEESDRLKTAFLANISHEIRTPLNAIVGFSDVLPMVQSEEEREQVIGLIRQNNAHLLRLFDDIVNMSKLEAGGDAVKNTRFSLHDLFQEMTDKYEGQARQKGLTLQEEGVASGDIEPFTDRERLRQILSQYLDNALKFTDKGCVTLGCDTDGQRLRIWVRDTGKGIPKEHCNEHLFERFVKVDDFIAGTGLGLSICRSLAQSMGGRVGVESELGKGSLFWIELEMED